MIRQYKIKLTNTKENFSCHWGYQCYGVLMEKLSAEYAAYLHEQAQTPIAQAVIPAGKNAAIWTINLLNQTAIEQVAPVIEQLENFTLRNRQITIDLHEKEVSNFHKSTDFLKYANRHTGGKNLFTLQFQTPLSFKSKEEYVFFPTVELILKSLIKKWNAFHSDMVIEDDEAVQMLLQGTKLISYDLQSHYYSLKQTKIPACTGKVVLSSRLSAPLLELVKLLLCYAQFAGIGIKNSLGMGKTIIEIR